MSPDFIVIGAQKAGTTWLDVNLRHHPDVRMPPVKATRYFMDAGRTPLALRALSSDADSPLWRHHVRDAASLVRRPRAWRRLAWYARFLGWPRGDDWYRSLFPDLGPGQVTGEVTPAYARLEPASVDRVAAVAPHARIVYLLRDPVERAWSNVRMKLRRSAPGAPPPGVATLREMLRRPHVRRHSDYRRTLEIWGARFPAEQLFIGYFDQLREDPAGLLVAVWTFLGVAQPERFVPADVAEQRFAGADPLSLPQELAVELARDHLPEYRALHDVLGSPFTERWLHAAEARAASADGLR